MESLVKEKEQSFSKKWTRNPWMWTRSKEPAPKLLETETRMQGLDGFQRQFLETLKKATLNGKN